MSIHTTKKCSCGCHTEEINIAEAIKREHACDCNHTHEEETHSCGCGHNHEHEEETHSCGCGHNHEHEEETHSCGCGHNHEHEEESHSCGCGHNHEHEEESHSCGCGHNHSHDNHGHEFDHVFSCGCGCDHSHDDNGHEFDHVGSCGCGHDHSNGGHDHDHSQAASAPHSTPLAYAGLGLSILSFFFSGFGVVPLIMMAVGIALIGYPLFIAGFKSIKRLQFDEMALLLIAVVAAIAIGEAPEAFLVTVLFRIGNYLEARAIGKSKREIAALTQIRPDTATIVEKNGSTKSVAAKSVKLGTLIQIKPGERIPLDCVVESGSAYIDSSALTGESIPVQAVEGSTILSGSINTDGLIICRTIKNFENSAASRIIKMVSEAAAQKGNAERMISKFAKVYTPIVIACAVALAILPPLFGAGPFTMWLGRSLVFLVASCPCALVISVPLTFFAGVGRATKSGILIKGTKYIETLAKVDCVAFDKTGTLTHGTPQVDEVYPLEGFTKEEVINYAAMAEQFSNHPAAKAIIAMAPEAAKVENQQYTETPGMGVSLATVDGTVHCGSHLLMEKNNISIDGAPKGNIYVAVNGKLIGVITLMDTIREDAKEAIARLHKVGVKTTAMLTGDNNEAAKKIAGEVGVTNVYSQLLPEDKVSRMAELKNSHTASVFVGDGINDAPVLAMSDAGIAMGLGTDTAIEAADIVLVNESLGSIADGIIISRKIVSKAKFNIAFALVIKAIVLVLGALGYAEMWMAVFADVGVSILAILNSVAPITITKE